jgi:hypothetical protein
MISQTTLRICTKHPNPRKTMTLDTATLDWTTGELAGWTYVEPVQRWFQGSFRAAHKLVRQCPTCSNAIELDVTTKALKGEAKNHGLALRRCKACRQALKKGPQAYTIHKEAVQQPVQGVPVVTDESLRSMVKVMTEEMDGLYAENKDLKARLAKYELQPALVRENLGHASNGGLPTKLPWE